MGAGEDEGRPRNPAGQPAVSVVSLTAVEGKGTSLDRSMELTEAIKEAVYRIGDGLPVALVVGCMEIAKAEILLEQRE